jgi:hexosaminidase
VNYAKLDAGWKDFAGRAAAQLPSLEKAGIAYRVAPPGARILGGILRVNSVFPGTRVQYRKAGGAWTDYSRPVPAHGMIELRSVSADGRRFSRTVEVDSSGN